ncbi:MAG: YaiI/YqxD family protein [Actinobacteria bacterium]|nr:YaiI/YqxD family protein [Actinomycetota bacterium]
MNTLFIDADACPVTRDAIQVARSRAVAVVLVANRSQNLGRFAGREGVEVMQVGSGPDSADFAMVPRLTPGDVVVTADIGLAAMALGRGCRALSPRGHQYLPATIDAQLAVRHAEQRYRRAGGRTTGPTPFQDEDRRRFREVLAGLLSNH